MVQTGSRQRITVVLGAGASHDVHNGSVPMSQERVERWKPPLATELFEPRESFNEIRVRYPGARVLAQVLQPKADAGSFDVEQELRRLSESSLSAIRKHFLDIPPYLRDVIWAVGQDPLAGGGFGYVQDPGGYQQLIHQLVADSNCDLAFVVLNYDTLLERSLEAFDPRTFTFSEIEDYVDEARQAIVLKVHGSVDWWVPLASRASQWRIAVEEVGLPKPSSSDLILIRTGIPHSDGAKNGNHTGASWLYPRITAPLAGKGPEALVCPPGHLDALGTFMDSCHKYLFIGTGGYDTDVLDFMDKRMPVGSFANFVGGGSAREAAKARNRILSSLSRKLENADVQPENDTYSDGFRAYLATSHLRDFAHQSLGSLVAEAKLGVPLQSQRPTSLQVEL